MKAICHLLLVSLAMTPTLAFGQATDEEPPDFTKFPDPLAEIGGNMMDFESNGHFTITNVRYGEAGYEHDKAVIWRLRANQSINFRHVEIFLRGVRQVRFYTRGKNMGRPVMSSLLFYARSLTADAANGEVLPKGGEIEVWIFLDQVAIGKLMGAHADNVVFSPHKRVK